MRKPVVNVTHITHEEWLNHRRTGIGGSDAATVVGLNPYESLYSLYNDKLGLLDEKEDTEAMRQGRDLEQYVADRWMERTGKRCRRNNYMWRSKEHPFMLADIDREIVGENAGLECKTTSVFNRSDFEGGNIPLTYYVQCMHYMAVMDFERMYLAVLVLNRGFYDFVIERDEAEIASLVEQEQAFWTRVVALDPPPIDGSESTREALKALYPREREEEYIVPLIGAGVDRTLAEIEELSGTVRCLQENIRQKESEIMAEMGDAPLAESNTYKVSWRMQGHTTVDAKRLRNEMPDVYKRFSRTSSSRVFRIKKKREDVEK